MNLVVKKKGEKPFVHEVLRVQRRDINTRGQELLHTFIDTRGACPLSEPNLTELSKMCTKFAPTEGL
jgi:hypothetical protein